MGQDRAMRPLPGARSATQLSLPSLRQPWGQPPAGAHSRPERPGAARSLVPGPAHTSPDPDPKTLPLPARRPGVSPQAPDILDAARQAQRSGTTPKLMMNPALKRPRVSKDTVGQVGGGLCGGRGLDRIPHPLSAPPQAGRGRRLWPAGAGCRVRVFIKHGAD